MRQLSEREQKVLEFVTEQHGDQKRKYSGEPYVEHCIEVAELVYKYTESEWLWIAAICHDLIEDTNCALEQLDQFLIDIEYKKAEAFSITLLVDDLTDKYTKEQYPNSNRKRRKFAEAFRLGGRYAATHTIKYADIISNTKSISRFDSGFAKTYLPEMVQLLHYMRKGNINLYMQACYEVYKGLGDIGLLEDYKFKV